MRVDIEALKEAMKKENLNLTGLAEKANVDKAIISRFFNGKSVCTISTAQRICTALKLSSSKAGSIFFAKDVA